MNNHFDTFILSVKHTLGIKSSIKFYISDIVKCNCRLLLFLTNKIDA